ncbi:hypothetical protein BST61_g4748 [Cercospora zeina]
MKIEEGQLDGRITSLEDGRHPPRPTCIMRFQPLRTKSRPRGQDRTKIIQRPICTRILAAMCRIRKLSKQERRRLSSKHSSSSHNKPGDNKLSKRRRSSLNDRGDHDAENSSQQDGFAAIAIRERSDYRQRENRPDGLRSVD